MTDNKHISVTSGPQFHLCGESALLMDFALDAFDLPVQQRLWSLGRNASGLRDLAGVADVVLGVNNVLVTFDPLRIEAIQLREAMKDFWAKAIPHEDEGRTIEVPVNYDMAAGSELEHVAKNAGLTPEEVITLHTSVDYWVSCIGWIPGFAFMSGLPPQIITPRKATPSLRVPKGSVGIGGSQTGIIPLEVPTGWYLIGKADISMFDPSNPEPCLLAPGDRVRFTVQEAGQ